MNIQYISGSSLPDFCLSELHGLPASKAWRFIPSRITRGSLRSTSVRSFRGECKKKQGWKVSNKLHLQSMTMPSGNALLDTTGTGQGSKYVSQILVLMKDILRTTMSFRPATTKRDLASSSSSTPASSLSCFTKYTYAANTLMKKIQL